MLVVVHTEERGDTMIDEGGYMMMVVVVPTQVMNSRTK